MGTGKPYRKTGVEAPCGALVYPPWSRGELPTEEKVVRSAVKGRSFTGRGSRRAGRQPVEGLSPNARGFRTDRASRAVERRLDPHRLAGREHHHGGVVDVVHVVHEHVTVGTVVTADTGKRW
jgi:hypothetical protein